MTTRKRRPPKRQAGRVSRLIAGGAAMIGAAAMRNPVATGGTAAFAIVFSFVAANALWYQPSSHPHPWLDTRDAFRDYAAKAMHPGGDAATTYRIERDATAPAEAAPQQAAQKPVDGVVVHDDPAPGADNIVGQIQANLARRGLYEGPVDGVMGSKTEAAIMFYQETRGLQQTGAADAAVLDLLKKDNAEFNVVPPDRPSDVTGAIVAKAPQKPVDKPVEKSAEKPAPKAADPVAALIAKTPRPQASKPQTDMTRSESVKAARPAVAPPIPPAPIPNASAKTAKQPHKPAEKQAEKPKQKPVQKAAEKPSDNAAQRAAQKPAPQKIVATSQRPAAIPAKAEAPAKSGGTPSNLTMAIQKGLSNLAYRDVTVDGVAREQTKEAIRHFEKHYRLPVTGEPNEAVLEKLKKIGAL
ncbi:peptidoglycan hydrolase-like protein with peptidoglycan-binding domain [Rhizobium aquaticum]|uniref:Peptidoglycan hydrolase-like protein with peptidoglycan-binding domain n=1 Tax=Rhizobium aquaticum TaxID=1549636 RepID=A0ABV2J051_9HYPH